MIKYEIKTDSFEFRFTRPAPSMTAREVFYTYTEGDPRIASNSCDPVTVASFDTLSEAQAAFAAKYANYGKTRSNRNGAFYLLTGDLAWIEENAYDGDDFDCNCGTHDVSAEAWEG